ncbi:MULTISPECIES: DUF5667 domain-containing protein [unclassified Solwaraspora]|uniref:DUF5667 domain-containing protein n=1 Tax=unclassified Solwaraspora TaxID=2627926 RepID=UPI00248C3F4A|nr:MULTISPECIES: DUF5667 domain-containing protein [unclassified Solwaraspora]WBB97628.1 DUF5667 domain-containing protein [Solwaraspora sp. WMMA2059]WBC18479.1 DUF5667 domain-containing protein [Solwaraspora sp. WMMA2080]WJK34107.1 DUF5667 domain-containing protein [Solwaraspora sp. WMMA2065]
MSKLNLFRRRAERFAQLLDRAEAGGRHHVRDPLDDELAGLTTLGRRMSEMPRSPESGVDPDYRAHLRAVLIATAEREGIGAGAPTAPYRRLPARPRSRWFATRATGARAATTAGRARTRAVIIATVAFGAITVSGMSAATEQAVPGDTLYGMKRSTERAQLALAQSDSSRGQLFLSFAEVRMGEALIVYDEPAEFSAVLDDMDGQTREGVRLLTSAATIGGDGTPLDVIDSFVATQRPTLRQLADGSAANRDRVGKSLTLLDRVRARTTALRDELTCSASATSDSDELGPLPARCVSAEPAGSIRVPGGLVGSPAGSSVDERRADVAPAPAAGAESPVDPEPDVRPSTSPQQSSLAEPQLGEATEPDLPGPRPAVKDNPAADR